MLLGPASMPSMLFVPLPFGRTYRGILFRRTTRVNIPEGLKRADTQGLRADPCQEGRRAERGTTDRVPSRAQPRRPPAPNQPVARAKAAAVPRRRPSRALQLRPRQ